jgi:integrase
MAVLVKDSRGRSKFWTCCFTAADGRRLKKSTKLTDKQEAMSFCLKLEEAERRGRGGTLTEEHIRKVLQETLRRGAGKELFDPTVQEWLEAWLKREEGALTDNTLKRYRQVAKDFLAAIGPAGYRRLEYLTADDVLKYRQELVEQGRTALTVNLVIKKVLKRAFKVAIDEGLMTRNPCAGVRPLRDGPRAEKGTFSPEQVVKLVDTAKGDWKGLILAAYFTGGRLSDLARLKWESVDLTKRTICFVQAKTGARIEIPIHTGLKKFLPSRPPSDNPKTPVFPELYSKPGAGKSGLSMAFKAIMEKAGMAPGVLRERKGKAGRNVSVLSFHSLRHSFNSALAAAGVSQELRIKLTGHATPSANAGYTHHELETIRTALESISKLPTDEKKV